MAFVSPFFSFFDMLKRLLFSILVVLSYTWALDEIPFANLCKENLNVNDIYVNNYDGGDEIQKSPVDIHWRIKGWDKVFVKKTYLHQGKNKLSLDKDHCGRDVKLNTKSIHVYFYPKVDEQTKFLINYNVENSTSDLYQITHNESFEDFQVSHLKELDFLASAIAVTTDNQLMIIERSHRSQYGFFNFKKGEVDWKGKITVQGKPVQQVTQAAINNKGELYVVSRITQDMYKVDYKTGKAENLGRVFHKGKSIMLDGGDIIFNPHKASTEIFMMMYDEKVSTSKLYKIDLRGKVLAAQKVNSYPFKALGLSNLRAVPNMAMTVVQGTRKVNLIDLLNKNVLYSFSAGSESLDWNMGPGNMASPIPFSDQLPPEVKIIHPRTGFETRDTEIEIQWEIDGRTQRKNRKVELTHGVNVIVRDAKNSMALRGADTIIVIRDTIKPVVEIAWPPKGVVTRDKHLDIKWRLDGVLQDSLTREPLKEGDNLVVRTIFDKAGNYGSDTVIVTRDTRGPKIEFLNVYHNKVVGQDTLRLQWSIDAVMQPEEYIPLKRGINTIIKSAEDRMGNKSTKTIQVVLDKAPPKVEIISPEDGYITNNPQLELRWTVEGVEKPVEHHLLAEGSNRFIRTGSDAAGNMFSDTIFVELDTRPPIVKIESPAKESKVNKSKIELKWTLDYEPQESSIRELKLGKNVLVQSGQDKVGNVASDTVVVWYNDQMPEVEILSPKDSIRIKGKFIDVEWTYNGKKQGRLTKESLKEGKNVIRREIRDKYGNVGNDSVTVFVDNSPPVVEIIYPENESSIFIPEANVEWTVDGTMQEIYRYPLKLGHNVVIMYAEDEMGNRGSDTIVVFYQDVRPGLQILNPKNNHTHQNEKIILDVKLDNKGVDLDLSTIEIFLDEDVYEEPLDIDDERIKGHIVMGHGPHTLEVKIKDVVGRQYHETVKFEAVFPEVKFDVTEPMNQATIHNSEVNVRGVVDDNIIEVRIDDSPAHLLENKFIYPDYPLSSGKNDINVVAIDIYGRIHDATVVVNFPYGGVTTYNEQTEGDSSELDDLGLDFLKDEEDVIDRSIAEPDMEGTGYVPEGEQQDQGGGDDLLLD